MLSAQNVSKSSVILTVLPARLERDNPYIAAVNKSKIH